MQARLFNVAGPWEMNPLGGSLVRSSRRLLLD